MLINITKQYLKREHKNTYQFRTRSSYCKTNISDRKSTVYVFLQALEKGIISIGKGMEKQYNEELIAKRSPSELTK